MINEEPKKRRSLYPLVILGEILIIVGILYIFRNRIIHKPEVKGLAAPIRKESLNCDNSSLNSYCEPIPGSVWYHPDYPNPSSVTDYYINSNGFNSQNTYSLTKDPSTYRILALGDSHTFGLYVNPGENYPARLENYLNKSNICNQYSKFEVLNLGFPGDDPNYSIYRYHKMGAQYNPDLVIWYLKNDDFVENEEEIGSLAQKCINGSENRDTVTYGKCWYKAYTDFYNSETKGSKIEEIRNLNHKLIKEFSDEFTNKKLLIYTYKDESDSNLEFLKSIKNPNVYIEADTGYKSVPRFSTDYHPTSEGYAVISNAIGNYIQSNILQCSK